MSCKRIIDGIIIVKCDKNKIKLLHQRIEENAPEWNLDWNFAISIFEKCFLVIGRLFISHKRTYSIAIAKTWFTIEKITFSQVTNIAQRHSLQLRAVHSRMRADTWSVKMASNCFTYRYRVRKNGSSRFQSTQVEPQGGKPDLARALYLQRPRIYAKDSYETFFILTIGSWFGNASSFDAENNFIALRPGFTSWTMMNDTSSTVRN